MSDTSRPSRGIQWTCLAASASPLFVGVADVLTISGPPDQKAGAAMGLVFIWIPLSLAFAFASAWFTCKAWRAATLGDKLLGLLPLAFPFVAFMMLCVSY